MFACIILTSNFAAYATATWNSFWCAILWRVSLELPLTMTIRRNNVDRNVPLSLPTTSFVGLHGFRCPMTSKGGWMPPMTVTRRSCQLSKPVPELLLYWVRMASIESTFTSEWGSMDAKHSIISPPLFRISSSSSTGHLRSKPSETFWSSIHKAGPPLTYT